MAALVAGAICAVLAICMVVPILGKDYTVGETAGWALGSDYSTWTKDKTFAVGDSLVFNYGGGHTVDEVSASDYNSCTVGNAITSDQSSPTTVTLKTAGTHYFICGVSGHCGGGMKLAVTVAAGGPSNAPSASGTPSSGTTTTTTPSTTSGGNTRPASTIPQSSSGAVSPFLAVITTWVAFCLMVFSS